MKAPICIAGLFADESPVILCVFLLVGVVSGAPAETNKLQQPKYSAWSRVMMRAYQASDAICCDRPPYLCECCPTLPCQ